MLNFLPKSPPTHDPSGRPHEPTHRQFLLYLKDAFADMRGCSSSKLKYMWFFVALFAIRMGFDLHECGCMSEINNL